ncbi:MULTISPECIES: hypothetical protein [unclassified Roseovarius]|uniref:hypothetical protein n=1 Tax=unclassified Roseovarius TaxID=2614913 RepID=UPI00273DC1C9|nr:MULTISPECIES: hypothetical protein [unclassified Roseovarius]
MQADSLVIALAIFTITAVGVFALISKIRTQRRLREENSTKSTLAADKRSDGDPADV